MSRRTASRWAEWESLGRRSAAAPIVPASAGPAGLPGGVPILTQQFGTGTSTVQLYVEIAWGADRSQNSTTWTWYDVTVDVLIGDNQFGIDITTGKQDERTTSGPSQLQLQLKNMANRYGQSPLGQNWPNVKRGTPVRCRIVYLGVETVLFYGYASAWQPTFDETGRYAVVQLTANGILRQLQQGAQPVQSTMRIYTPNVSNLVAYWPMEDGTSATVFAAATPNTQPMTFAAANLASNSSAVGSNPLPVLNGSTWCTVPLYTPTNAVQVRFIGVFPPATGALPDKTPICRVFTSGSISYTDITYDTGGGLQVTVHSAVDGSVVYDSGAITFSVDGKAGQISLSMAQSGANIALQISLYTQGSVAAGYWTTTITGQTIIAAQFVQFLPVTSTSTQLAIGHLTVQSAASDVFENAQPINGYDGETQGDRYQRLLPLVGAEARGVYSATSGWATRMGPQKPDTVLNLLRETETTDIGVILDGHDASLTNWSHDALENLPVTVTLDAQQYQLMPPVSPIDDDQKLRNDWTLTQRGGSSVHVQDTTSSNSVQAVGLYADSATINLTPNATGGYSGAQGIKGALDRANWLVHLGTVSGYRYPTLQLGFHHNPELLASWLSIWNRTGNNIGNGLARVQVLNLGKVYPAIPDEVLDLFVIGVNYHITKFTWTATPNLVSYEGYKVGVLGQPSGDTGEFVMRLDTSGSSLAAAVAQGASPMTVQTTVGPVWTTRADDFPLYVRVGGIKVKVTSISGATSPQTFTVDPATVVKNLPASSDVRLWNPPVIGIGGT